MENRKTKSENYQNTDENREKFVKEFNENVLDLEKLNNPENAFKVERELENGQKIDFYTLRGGKFNLLVSSPFLGFMNPKSSDGRNSLMNSQEDIIQASKMSLEDVRKTYGFGNNYISASLISDENFQSINWGKSPWSFGYSQISPEDLINGGTSDQFTLGEKTERGESGELAENLFENIHFDDGGYNEIALWRYPDQNEPRKPDFIVTTDRSVVEFGGKNLPFAMKAAAEFDIPLVLIQRSGFESQKLEKIEQAMEANFNGEISDADFLNLYLRGAQSFEQEYSPEQKLYANDAYERHLENVAEIMENLRKNQNFETKNGEELAENLQNIREIFAKRDAVIQSWSDAFLSKAGISKGFRAEIFENKNGETELEFVPSQTEIKLQKIMLEAEMTTLSKFLDDGIDFPVNFKPFLEKIEADFVEIGDEKMKISDGFWRVNLGEIWFRLDEFEGVFDGKLKKNHNFIGDRLNLSQEELRKLNDLAERIEK